jgi:TolB protein
MRRLIVLATVTGMTLLGLVAAGGATRADTSSARDGKIAFTRLDVGIFTINPDGTGETEVAPSECAAWSPDSTKLLTCPQSHDGFERPATANPNGSGFRLLDHYPHLQQPLACSLWSPDASRFLCSTDVTGANPADGIYTVRSSDGGHLVRLTKSPNRRRDIPLGYAPKPGTGILFDRSNPATDLGNLYVMNHNGSHQRRLNPPRLLLDTVATPAHWSPDGAWIVFGGRTRASAAEGQIPRTRLYLIKPDGTGIHRITASHLGGYDPVWSPNGHWIAFNSKFRSGAQIYVVHPDGTGLRQLTFHGADGDTSWFPVWSPGSRKLVFQSFHPEITHQGQEDLWIVNVKSGKLTQLTDTPGWEYGFEAPVGPGLDWGSGST